MTYNELAQVLESKNPKTGKLYQLSDLNVIKMQSVGTGMLEDGLFSTAKWLNEPGATRRSPSSSSRASLQGWIYCRDHQAAVRRHDAEGRPDPAEGPPDRGR